MPPPPLKIFAAMKCERALIKYKNINGITKALSWPGIC